MARKKPHRLKPIAEAKERFARARSLQGAVDLVKSVSGLHSRYSHYTKVSTVKKILEAGQWWLTCANSKSFDDLHEAKKYGSEERLRKLYLASFSYQHSESAAMWKLYSDCDENAVRVSLPKTFLRDWVKALNSKKSGLRVYPIYNGLVGKKSIAKYRASICDVIYASVKWRGEEKPDGKCLCWNDQFTVIKDLGIKKNLDFASGVLKDYEWRFEYESRLRIVILSDEAVGAERIAVDVPTDIREKMKVVLSPWIGDNTEIQKSLRASLGVLDSDEKVISKSVLTGALEKWAKAGQKEESRKEN